MKTSSGSDGSTNMLPCFGYKKVKIISDMFYTTLTLTLNIYGSTTCNVTTGSRTLLGSITAGGVTKEFDVSPYKYLYIQLSSTEKEAYMRCSITFNK